MPAPPDASAPSAPAPSAPDAPALPDLRALVAEHRRVIDALDALVPQVEAAGQRLVDALRAGGKVLWMGNGGSAADSQHLAAELVGRFQRERRAYASVALTTDTSVLTAVANDYGYATVFERQIEALCRPADAVVGITTSGNSANVVQAVRRARALGAFTLGLTGAAGGRLADEADLCLRVPSSTTARIQEAHLLIGHLLCDWVETALTADAARPSSSG
jgi:D-sedoheptulose 7-phosphate isomerase